MLLRRISSRVAATAALRTTTATAMAPRVAAATAFCSQQRCLSSPSFPARALPLPAAASPSLSKPAVAAATVPPAPAAARVAPTVTASDATLRAQLRTFTSLTPVGLMRSRGDGSYNSDNSYIKMQDSPMNTGGGASGGGSQADSLTPYVREHLFRVYSLLGLGVVSAGLGSFLMLATPLGHAIPYWLPMLGGFVPLLWLSFAPPANPTLKLGLFFAFTTLEGMGLAPLILMTSMKGVLVTSLLLTGAIFCGFSAAAYLAPRASMVAWQGPLFGALLGLVGISVVNIFWPTAIAHSLILYGGLALFSVMVAADTQAMIERARCGAGDYVNDALQMFLNVVNIFVRIAQIMGNQN